MHKELEASANEIAMDSFKGESVARIHDLTLIPSLQQRLRHAGERKAAARSVLRGKQAHRVDCDADLTGISRETTGQEKGGRQYTVVTDLMEPSGPDLACKAKKDGGPDALNSDSLNMHECPVDLGGGEGLRCRVRWRRERGVRSANGDGT
ncbi:hypothetical protein Ancab_008383 [Ancistrocladus abbreviatus]